jgi:hypothetical protein
VRGDHHPLIHGFEPYSDDWLSSSIMTSCQTSYIFSDHGFSQTGYMMGDLHPRSRLYSYRFRCLLLIAHEASSRAGQVMNDMLMPDHGFEPSRICDGCSSSDHGLMPTGSTCRPCWHTRLRAEQVKRRMMFISDHGFEPRRSSDGWCSYLITASSKAGYMMVIPDQKLRAIHVMWWEIFILDHGSKPIGYVTGDCHL